MIEVRAAAGVKGVSVSWVKKVVARTLKAEKAKRRAVSVLLTTNSRIKALNKKYLKHDTATDVISFWSEPETLAGGQSDYLGDIVVSVQMARAVSKELRITFKEELARYLVHGTLHLLGYQDLKKKDKMRMDRRQELLLKRVL